jgi:hypothetical protein
VRGYQEIVRFGHFAELTTALELEQFIALEKYHPRKVNPAGVTRSEPWVRLGLVAIADAVVRLSWWLIAVIRRADCQRQPARDKLSANMRRNQSSALRGVANNDQNTRRLSKVEKPSELGDEQQRALRLLADAPHGRTLAIMLAHGFPNAMLDRLVSDRLATIQPGTVCFGTRRITVAWVAISEVGLQGLADAKA